MSIVVREQDILKKEPNNIEGYWSENAIRGYQESHGINYGATVFQRGIKPNREWSNDRYFNDTPQVADGSVPEKHTVQDDMTATINSLREEIQKLKSEKESMKIPSIPMTGVERH